ncbi:MAG: PilN domain-containing protein [Bryobacteraceae bacterium]|nr:PilN domain-containing protein [Bryobacteraceae bacterium]
MSGGDISITPVAPGEPPVPEARPAVPRKAAPGARKWLAVGTGVGIEIQDDDLRVTVARVRPRGVRILGTTLIERFRQRPAAEWGAEYADFLARTGAGHLAATVLLPRRELVVRPLTLPGVKKRDAEAAIRFQIDSLHPYPEDEAQYGWSPTGDAGAVLIGIARTQVVDRYASLFAEAGVRVASFTFSAAALHAALRLLDGPPEGGFLIAGERRGGVEVYGESAARPAFSAVFDAPPEKAVALAAAELRLEGEVRPYRAADLLPAPGPLPPDTDLDELAFSYAGALAAACPWLGVPANLLPAAQRGAASRAVYIPTIALAALLVAAVIGLAVYGRIEDRRYLAALEAEAARLTPEAMKVHDLEDRIAALRARRQALRDFRLRTRSDLDALQALTRLLEPPAWVNSLELTRSAVTMNGESPHSAALLETIDKSPLFRNSEFMTPISKAGQSESFAIRAQREGAP